MLGSATCTVRKRRASASSSWMYSLYSLSVVAPIMRTSPRASTDLKTLAASDGAPSAEPAPTIVCASSTNRIRLGRSLISRMTFWMRSSNMPRSIVPATIVFICRLTTWQSRRRTGHDFGLELDTPREALGPGSPTSIKQLERSPRHRISSTCRISSSRPEHRRWPLLGASRFTFVGTCSRNAGSSEALLQPLVKELHLGIRLFNWWTTSRASTCAPNQRRRARRNAGNGGCLFWHGMARSTREVVHQLNERMREIGARRAARRFELPPFLKQFAINLNLLARQDGCRRCTGATKRFSRSSRSCVTASAPIP